MTVKTQRPIRFSNNCMNRRWTAKMWREEIDNICDSENDPVLGDFSLSIVDDLEKAEK